MYNESLSDEELEEVKSLSDIFSDLEPSIVRLIYIQCDRDYRRSQEKLAEVAKDPAAKAQLLLQQLPVSSSFNTPGSGQGHTSSSGYYNDDDLSRSQGTRGSGAALSGLAALALAPAPSDAPSNGAYLPTLPSFDVNTLTETLTQVGNSVSDGITSFANNITGWVADLASAFDSGWGDEGEERLPQSDKNEPAVGYGTGVGIDRPYQRRLNTHVSVDRQPSHHRVEAEADPNEEDEWEEGDEGYGKDD